MLLCTINIQLHRNLPHAKKMLVVGFGHIDEVAMKIPWQDLNFCCTGHISQPPHTNLK